VDGRALARSIESIAKDFIQANEKGYPQKVNSPDFEPTAFSGRFKG